MTQANRKEIVNRYIFAAMQQKAIYFDLYRGSYDRQCAAGIRPFLLVMMITGKFIAFVSTQGAQGR